MDPFLLSLIVSFLLVKGSVEDLVYAFKGKESPRIRARKERMADKSVAAKLAHAAADKLADRIVNGAKPKGPMRQYFADLWEDAWDTATDSRRRAKEDKAERAAAGRADDADPLGEVPDPPDPAGSSDDAADSDAKGRAGSDDGSTADDEPAGSGGRKRRWWTWPPYWWSWYTPTPSEPEPDTEPIRATAERTDGAAPEEPKAVTTGPAALPPGASDSSATSDSTAKAGATTDDVVDAEVVEADVLCDKACKNSTISPAEARAKGLCPNCGGFGNRRTEDFHGYHEHIKCNVCGGTGKFNDPNDKSPEGKSDSPTPTTKEPVTSSTPETAALPGGSTTMTTTVDTTTTGGSEGGLTSAIKYAEKMIASCDKALVSLEQTAGALEAKGWSGDATGGFRAAKDGYIKAKAEIQRSLNSLVSSLTVKDGYNANQDAGEKESVIAE